MNDLKYPFGNEYQQRLHEDSTRIAINNLLQIAEDRLWISTGRPNDGDLHFDDIFTDAESVIIKDSICKIRELLNFVDDQSV